MTVFEYNAKLLKINRDEEAVLKEIDTRASRNRARARFDRLRRALHQTFDFERA